MLKLGILEFPLKTAGILEFSKGILGLKILLRILEFLATFFTF